MAQHSRSEAKDSIRLVGIDIAVDERKTGLALGSWSGEGLTIDRVCRASSSRPRLEILVDWLDEPAQTLIAIDSPLGWPQRLGIVLMDHVAGGPASAQVDEMFFRYTDRVVKDKLGLKTLEVGADRIARAAWTALELLRELRIRLDQEIPLAWTSRLKSPISAIEVYPKATLTSRGIPTKRYKGRTKAKQLAGRPARETIVSRIERECTLDVSRSELLGDDHLLDACVCVLAGADFLSGHAMKPPKVDVARKEGWIWFLQPLSEISSRTT